MAESSVFDNSRSSGDITLIVLAYLPVVLYSPVLEILLKGKTIGKLINKTRVVKTNGKYANVGSILLRWLLKAVDFKIGLLFFFLAAIFTNSQYFNAMNVYAGLFMTIPFPIVGLILIIKTKTNQRLGDIAAETIVIHEKKRVSLDDTILQHKEDDYTPVFKEAINLRDKDIYIIKKVIDKAETEMNHTDVIPLAEKAKKVLKIKTDMLPLVFLKTLVKDYNHVALNKDL